MDIAELIDREEIREVIARFTVAVDMVRTPNAWRSRYMIDDLVWSR